MPLLLVCSILVVLLIVVHLFNCCCCCFNSSLSPSSKHNNGDLKFAGEKKEISKSEIEEDGDEQMTKFAHLGKSVLISLNE